MARIAGQLPEERRAAFLLTVPSSNPFETSFQLDTAAHRDFTFRPTFRFSWGLVAWGRGAAPLLRNLLSLHRGSGAARHSSTLAKVHHPLP